MYYYLDDSNKPIPCDAETAFIWHEAHRDRIFVKKTHISEVEVSTVFIPINLSSSDELPPTVFETMIFGGLHDQYMDRYRTYEAALKGHHEAVKLVVESLIGDSNGRESKN